MSLELGPCAWPISISVTCVQLCTSSVVNDPNGTATAARKKELPTLAGKYIDKRNVAVNHSICLIYILFSSHRKPIVGSHPLPDSRVSEPVSAITIHLAIQGTQ